MPYMEQLLLPECQIQQQIDHRLNIFLEEGALEIGAFHVVVEVNAGTGLAQKLTA